MRTCKDNLTGKPFRWNTTVIVDGVTVPARSTSRTATHLHPHRVPPALLHELNPEPSSEPRTVEWTASHSAAALKQGWDVFEANTEFRLERNDEAAVFPDDEAAWKHVAERARTDDATCAHALLFLALHSPQERERIRMLTGH